MRLAVVAALFAALAVGVVLGTTREGIGATVDSGEYLAVADGLRHDHGFTMPFVGYDEPYPEVVRTATRTEMTQFPPLFPVTVAAVATATGTSVLDAARWVNALALGGIALLTCLLVGRATSSAAWAAVAGALVVAPTFVYTASMAWSEPLMLALLLGTIAALMRHLRDGSTRWLAIAVALAALSSMVRFTGLSAVVAVAFVVLVTARSWRRALAVLAVGLLPEVLWFARNTLLIGAPSEKPLTWHPPGEHELQRIARSLTSWVVRDTPTRRGFVLVLVACALLLFCAVAVRAVARRTVDWTSLPAVCAVFGVAYGTLVLAARATFDNNIDLSTRQLLALELLLIVGGVALATGRRAFVVGAVAGLVIASSAFRLATTTVREFPRSDRTGYTSAPWDRSAGLAYVRSLPADTVVVTNAPEAVWLRTGRSSLFLPLAANLYAGGPNLRYDDELAALSKTTDGRDAVVVFFDRPTRGRPRTIDDRIIRALGLHAAHDLGDASVYALS